jgi:hypothetical protein
VDEVLCKIGAGGSVAVYRAPEYAATAVCGKATVYSLKGDRIGVYPATANAIITAHQPLPAGAYLLKNGNQIRHFTITNAR